MVYNCNMPENTFPFLLYSIEFFILHFIKEALKYQFIKDKNINKGLIAYDNFCILRNNIQVG